MFQLSWFFIIIDIKILIGDVGYVEENLRLFKRHSFKVNL